MLSLCPFQSITHTAARKWTLLCLAAWCALAPGLLWPLAYSFTDPPLSLCFLTPPLAWPAFPPLHPLVCCPLTCPFFFCLQGSAPDLIIIVYFSSLGSQMSLPESPFCTPHPTGTPYNHSHPLTPLYFQQITFQYLKLYYFFIAFFVLHRVKVSSMRTKNWSCSQL